MKNPQVGERVCYARQFLQSTGQLTGEIPAARGTIKLVEPFGFNQIVTIDWGNPNIPNKVMAHNLSRITAKRGIEESN